MYAMKSNNTAHIRNAVLVGEASLREYQQIMEEATEVSEAASGS